MWSIGCHPTRTADSLNERQLESFYRNPSGNFSRGESRILVTPAEVAAKVTDVVAQRERKREQESNGVRGGHTFSRFVCYTLLAGYREKPAWLRLLAPLNRPASPRALPLSADPGSSTHNGSRATPEKPSRRRKVSRKRRTGGCVRSRSASRQQEELLVPVTATHPDYIESR
ncbi:hypothetical protein EAG_01830 [Camponotus floridanus]|uniref:Uncharacterized protein n=1 Tax=Camponotus floridanus TaxID=104421 RepID=E2AQ05_CAMFO|nr:hypothetical protein EAG_01830 [Camponotus floridanus]